ncbi:MAG TPA: hypothetical protein VHA06_18925 [Candidatus Angelobacter sp.]|jgi:uncharacterized membrane protein|nr:hypothetical protein [Candidatus Angelobacter sp.]
MLSSTNFWMGLAGLVYLVAGIFILRKEISAARGWDKLVTLAPVFIAAPLAAFAPEHFRGPDFVKNMVPSWMPLQVFWAYFVGCALLAAATSLTARKCMRLSSIMLGLMFFLFVCMIYLPGALRHSGSRFAWIFLLRDLSFAAGAWALAGLLSRAASPQPAKWMILFGRMVIAIAAIFYAVQHFLFPKSVPDIPLELITPAWVPFPSAWAYLAGAILLAAGVCLAVNKKSRMAAISIGALMTAAVLFLYLPILLRARGEPAINEGLNYVADTLLYAGAALALASALPREP